MHKSKISIIIPVYNEEKSIGELIQALWIRQSGNVGEIIVVDGGSTDQTVSIAAKNGAKVISSDKKRRSSQMNRGAETAAYNILYFLHADTFPPLHFDQFIVNVFNNCKAGCFQLRFNDPSPILQLYSKGTALKTALVRFGDQSLFVDKNIFHQVGGFDENLVVMEDQKIVREIKKITSFQLLDKYVTTSARKYRNNGLFKLQFIFTMVWLGYYLGVKQEVLVHFYHTMISK